MTEETGKTELDIALRAVKPAAWMLPVEYDEHGSSGPYFYFQPERPFKNNDLLPLYAAPPDLEAICKQREKAVLERIADHFTFGSKNADISSRVFLKDCLAAVGKDIRRMVQEL